MVFAPRCVRDWPSCAPSLSGKGGRHRRIGPAGDGHRPARTVHCAQCEASCDNAIRHTGAPPGPDHADVKGVNVRDHRPVDAGDVVDVGPTPVMRAIIGLAVGLAVGALLALLLPRGMFRRR